ncbi:M23 family metallopeptidase [Salinibacterium sp. ZJ454]|uniref:M23 family metallopeptidase n=1 Tax=Salinibacterium sp. ZJ454 TaxID=2708339 RepID=UPI001423089E|nr:M23 family metallopeptidase [Salinibacterium sp. ZJ454]
MPRHLHPHPARPHTVHPHTTRLSGFLHVSRSTLAVTATLFAGGLTAISSVPAAAAPADFHPVSAVQPTTLSGQLPLQSLDMPATALDPAVARDGFGVTILPPPPPPVVEAPAAPSAAVGWPLASGTTMTADFGPRPAPCAGCSSNHLGIDWTPGAGTPISAVAAGVVTEATSAGAFGVHVKIEHTIGGTTYTSLYAHMQAGSMAVSVGDSVGMGEQIGKVGSTGASTGAHLHLEIHDAGGTPIDPYSWLTARI